MSRTQHQAAQLIDDFLPFAWLATSHTDATTAAGRSDLRHVADFLSDHYRVTDPHHAASVRGEHSAQSGREWSPATACQTLNEMAAGNALREAAASGAAGRERTRVRNRLSVYSDNAATPNGGDAR